MAMIAVAGYANLNGNGYYRVKNYGSDRWASLIDNKAQIDKVGGNADLHAMELNNNTEEILSDPGSVIYISSVGNGVYDVAAQGVSLRSLVDNNLKISKQGTENGQDVYFIYGTYSGATKYIGDANVLKKDQYGYASINVSSATFRKWYIIPVDVKTDNYFGAVPSVTSQNGLFTTLFTSFAYQPYSQNVNAYYINRVGYGMAEMVKISGTVPAGTPVVIECAGKNVADNKLQISSGGNSLTTNSLKGVYFDYSGYQNVNQVKYDPKTMRILGTCADGSLGFVVANIESIPANTAYLTVPAGSPSEIKCVSTKEYDEFVSSLPENYYFGDYVLPLQNNGTYTGSFELPAFEETENLYIRFYPTASNDGENFIGADSSGNVNLTPGSTQTLPFSYNSPNYWVLSNWEGGTLNVTLNILDNSVTFSSKLAAVDMISANPNALHFDGSKIYTDALSNIVVYNLSGKKMCSTFGNSLDVTSLAKGVYTVVANGKSIKIKL